MPLISFGINHKTAPVTIRERVAFSPELLAGAHTQLCESSQAEEAVILSTCNRTEIYVHGDRDDLEERVLNWLAHYHQLAADDLACYTYSSTGEAGVLKHLSEVASGLDSLILGEPQILGQLKSAFEVARGAGTVQHQLHQLFTHAFSTAKQVRTRTAIGRNPVSVAFAAADLATRIFTDLRDSTALLVGAGETIDLVAKHLRERGVKKMIVANRTLANAERLAREFHAEAILLADIPDHLHRADIVISSTASQLPIIGKGAVEYALKKRKRRPMYMVDIAVPRDIETAVGDLEDIFLYTVDDLQEVVAQNVENRRHAAEEALIIIDQCCDDYARLQREKSFKQEIALLRQNTQAIAEREVEHALRLLHKGDDAEEVIRLLAHRLSNKYLHQPSIKLREAGKNDDRALAEAALELFDLKMTN